MAKTVSPIFKFQGTIEDLTFVNSKRYKPHVRAKKYSKTAFVMTAPLAEGKARMQECNQYAKPIFQALRAEVHDGALWSRLVSKLFAELKAGRPLGLECLKGFECNLQHPLSEVIGGSYDFSATVSQNQLGLYVQLHQHPLVADSAPRTGYQVRFVALVPDVANGTVTKVEALGPLTKYKSELSAFDLPIKLPETGGPCLLLMGIVPHLQGEGPARIMSDSGMRVVWVGDTSCELRASSCERDERQATEERQAASGELRATSEIQEGMAKEEGTGERQASSYEARATSGRDAERMLEEAPGDRIAETVALAASAAEKVSAEVLVEDEGSGASFHSLKKSSMDSSSYRFIKPENEVAITLCLSPHII